MYGNYRILIGSVGDDSHSIGMALLEIAFQEIGYYVKNIGILNQLDDFFYQAENFDAVFISCMNGHADLYLQDFPHKYNLFKNTSTRRQAWYLGGNLSVRDSDETVIRKYLAMGFDFIAPKPIPFETLYKQLREDFHRKGIKPRDSHRLPPQDIEALNLEYVEDSPMPDHEFLRIREQVLATWKTGTEVLTTSIRENHSDQRKNLHHLIVRTMHNGSGPLVQPRTGVAHTNDEIEILRHLRANGLDVSSIQLDAASRKNLYAKANEGVEKTEKGKISLLNGYPVPVHGVTGIKQILNAIDTPFQIRAGSPDHRLVYEIGLAGGTSSIEGGFLCYLFPYDKSTSPLDSLGYWKYVDKLAANYYSNYGTIINREYFGPLTCCLVEPSIPITINIVQAMLSAISGVKCISVGLAEQGNRIQDIAALRVLRQKTNQYLHANGYSDVTVSTVFHQYMAAFPSDRNKARDLIVNSSITAVHADADRIMTKTPVESIHIPTKENNAEGLSLTRQGIRKAHDVNVDWNAVQAEAQILSQEVDALISYILISGNGSYARGSMKAFQEGILDIQFSPSKYNKNQLFAAKDCNGAIRFINPEGMPFSDAIKDFHREKISQRMIKERVAKIYKILEHDLTRIWQNDYFQWPLDGCYID